MRLSDLTKQIVILLAFIATGVFCPSVGVQADPADDAGAEINAESDSSVGGEQRFVEIELSPTGVIAYDAAGNEYTYDFQHEEFVLGGTADAGESPDREGDAGSERVEPVEIRCTEEKIVAYPALKAVYVGRDEYVDGDIAAYSRITIKGWVRGSVQSFDRPVLVTATGQVDGDIRAPEIEVREGGIVLGDQIVTGAIPVPLDDIAGRFEVAGIWVVFGFTIALTLIAFLMAALAPQAVDNMSQCAQAYPVRSALTGLLFLFLSPFITGVVILTVIGILVAWLVPLIYLAAFAMGLSVLGVQFCGPLVDRFTGLKSGMTINSLAGVLIYMALWTAVAILLGAGSASSFQPLGVILLVIAIVGTSIPLFVGIGVVFLTRFGRRKYVVAGYEAPADEPAAPAPPPMPRAPSMVPRPRAVPRPPSARPEPILRPPEPPVGDQYPDGDPENPAD